MDSYEEYLYWRRQYRKLKMSGGHGSNSNLPKTGEVRDPTDLEETKKGTRAGAGVPTPSSAPLQVLIVTHSARLRCWMMRYVPDWIDTRFKNGAALRLSVRPGNPEATLELLVEGYVDPKKSKKKSYYVRDNVRDKVRKIDLLFPHPCSFPVENFIPASQITQPIDLIIVRHGEGHHNLMNRWQKVRHKPIDPALTPTGRNEMEKTRIELLNLLGRDWSPHWIYVSYLQRTQETAALLLPGQPTVPFRLLPCSHELSFETGGRCDATFQKKWFIPWENRPRADPFGSDYPATYHGHPLDRKLLRSYGKDCTSADDQLGARWDRNMISIALRDVIRRSA